MSRKYGPLTGWLQGHPDASVTLTFADLEGIVGPLPRSSRVHRPWWGNATHHPHSRSWISAGWVVAAVDLNAEVVTFERGTPVSRGGGGREQILDGTAALEAFARRAGYARLEEAVAEHTVFLHPDTVAQTAGRAVFPVVRDMNRRGELGHLDDGTPVMFCDNTTAKDAFLWSADLNVGPDIQFNHVWGDSRDVGSFTALWNLCCTPAFLAKTTDTHPGVSQMLEYRSYDLYGHHPAGAPAPGEPDGYGELVWAEMPSPAANLEQRLRRRLNAGPKRRAAIAAREIGWAFSDGPDQTLRS